MFDENNKDAKTTIFPVTMLKVSKEWVDNLFNEIKRTVMTKAISCDCSKEFLASLNELNLTFSDDAKIHVSFPNNIRTESTPEPLSNQPNEVPTASSDSVNESKDDEVIEDNSAETEEDKEDIE